MQFDKYEFIALIINAKITGCEVRPTPGVYGDD